MNEILEGELKSGDKLPIETELMEKYDTSRTVIREAIKMLTSMGVLIIKRGSGTFVADRVNTSMINPLIFSMIINPKGSYELYELRTVIESGAIKLAIDNATEEDIEKIKDNLDRYESSIKDGSCTVEKAVELDVEFHTLIMKAGHNALMERIGETVFMLYPRYIKKSFLQKSGFSRTLERHTMILNAVIQKKSDNLFSLVESTLDEWKNNWKE